jgi:Ras-related protein Rab-1A
MEQDIITGIVYTELDEEIGPNPIIWYPSDLAESLLLHISIKTLTLLSGEHGIIPESLIIMPFQSLNLKSIIKYLQWNDKDKRGGIGQAAITLLFKDFNDLIFYKYKENLEDLFNESKKIIIKLKERKADDDQINAEVRNLNSTITATLERLKTEEETAIKKEEIPKKTKQISDLIDYKFKIIFCGDPGVGKTSLVLRFSENAFTRKYVPTLGVNVSDKIVRVDESVVQLVLWDLAGQTKFQYMRHSFYQGSDGVFFIFDLTNLKTFNKVREWYKDVQKNLKNNPKLMGFLIGNKNDLLDGRVITNEEANQIAKELNLGYIETSALTGENVINAFQEVAKELLKSISKS